MQGLTPTMMALVALMALVCAAAQPRFPYCTCSDKRWASSPFILTSTAPPRVLLGSVELGFELKAKPGWTDNGSPCAQALSTSGVAKLHIASSLACIGRGPVRVYINGVLCTECKAEEAPNVPGFAQIKVKFRSPVTLRETAAIRVVGSGPCSGLSKLLDISSNNGNPGAIVRYAVFSTRDLKPRECCPRSSVRTPVQGGSDPPSPSPAPRAPRPPPRTPRAPRPSPDSSPSLPPAPKRPVGTSLSPPSPPPPSPPGGNGLVICSGSSTDGGVCAAQTLPTKLGLCINRACCGSQGTALLQSQLIGKVEKLVFTGKNTANFNVAGGLKGSISLGSAGPTQTKLTLDGVEYTVTFGSTNALVAVSASNGVQLTIYPPSGGKVRVVFFSRTYGSADFQLPFSTSSGTSGRRLQQGGGGGGSGGGGSLCLPSSVRSFCTGFRLTSAPGTAASSAALRNLAVDIALKLQQLLELSSDSLSNVCGGLLAGVAATTTSCGAISALEAFNNVSTCANPPPLPPQAACDSFLQSGNQGTFSYTVPVGDGTNVALDYNAYSIPDIFRVFDAATGAKLFEVVAGSSGSCIEPDVPGAGSVNITKPFASTSLIVEVEAPCRSTVWDFTLNCAT